MTLSVLENFVLVSLIIFGSIIVGILLDRERLHSALKELRAAYDVIAGRFYGRLCEGQPRELLEGDLPQEEEVI